MKQTELLNRLTKDFVKSKGDVAYLTVCPTDYSKLWANPTPQGSLAIYGETLDPSIEVFWTGDVVCSDLTPETLDWVNSRIKRPAYFGGIIRLPTMCAILFARTCLWLEYFVGF